MLTPRSYQVDAYQSVFNYFQSGNTGNPLIAAPTGTGKSIIVAMLNGLIVQQWANQRIINLTHVAELIEQNYEKFETCFPQIDVGIYSAGLKRSDTNENVIFAGIQSVAKKAVLFGHIDLVVIDECHLVSPNTDASYGKFIEDLKLMNPHLKVIGLTATPYRLGLGLMTNGQIFTDICYDTTQGDDFLWFVEEGFLCPLVPKPTTTKLDIEGVKKRGGEFIAKDLQKAVDKIEATQQAVKETIVVGTKEKRYKWMFFCSGIDHVDNVAAELRANNIDVRVVHSKMNNSREEAINWFKAPSNGKVKALVNADTLTTGFDCTDLDLLAIIRPTMSPGLWVQILGRGTRPHYAQGYDLTTKEGRLASIANSVKKNCMVLDFAENTARLGPINRVEIPNKKGKGGGECPTKICPSCDTYVWAAARFCEHCNHEFPPPENKIKTSASNKQLIDGFGDDPNIKEIDVSQVMYQEHMGRGSGNTTLKVTYLCGVTSYNEYISLGDWPHRPPSAKARAWWKNRSHGVEPPNFVSEAVEHAKTGMLKVPQKITVRVGQKYPEILGYSNYE